MCPHWKMKETACVTVCITAWVRNLQAVPHYLAAACLELGHAACAYETPLAWAAAALGSQTKFPSCEQWPLAFMCEAHFTRSSLCTTGGSMYLPFAQMGLRVFACACLPFIRNYPISPLFLARPPKPERLGTTILYSMYLSINLIEGTIILLAYLNYSFWTNKLRGEIIIWRLNFKHVICRQARPFAIKSGKFLQQGLVSNHGLEPLTWQGWGGKPKST